MTSLEEIREILFEDHVVTVKFKGMRGTKRLFSALLPQVPRPGDVVTYRQKHKHGQGEYRVLRVEWIRRRARRGRRLRTWRP